MSCLNNEFCRAEIEKKLNKQMSYLRVMMFAFLNVRLG